MKIKRFILLISVLSFSLFASGCGQSLMVMSDSEEEVIALYAAKMVAKFNKNQTTGICNVRVKEGELDEAYGLAPEDETVAGDDNTADESLNYDPETGELISPELDEETQVDEGYSFTDAIAIEGVEFECSSFNVCSEFKASSSFILTEVKGKSYLVLYIDGTNTTDNDIDFSNLSEKTFNLSLNSDSSSKSASQSTPLNNDLSSYDGVLAAGETKSFVLVFQFSNSSVENITSLNLEVTSDGNTRGTSI